MILPRVFASFLSLYRVMELNNFSFGLLEAYSVVNGGNKPKGLKIKGSQKSTVVEVLKVQENGAFRLFLVFAESQKECFFVYCFKW